MQDIELFTIWLTNTEWGAMPYMYELCIASWQVMNPNKKIVIYANHNLHLSLLDRTITEIRQIKDYFPGLYETAKTITDNKAHQSDYIRYSILERQKGIYFDTDVLCYRNCDDIIQNTLDKGKDIMFPLEDHNMICNAFIGRFTDYGKEVFSDIVTNYHNRYIKHSYLFNSQKYLWLMARRYPGIIHLYEVNHTIFNPSWQLFKYDQDKMLMDVNYNEYNKLGFNGIGFHLYSSVPQWNEFRQFMDENMYNKEPKTFITRLMKYIIDQYINLMKEAD